MTIPLSSLPETTAGDPRPLRRGWFGRLLRRLHFYAEIFIGPFILIAALSGSLYAISPQIEEVVYTDELTAPMTDSYLPLADQVTAVDAFVGSSATPSAVRPAPEPGATTRVMYADPILGDSESRSRRGRTIVRMPGTRDTVRHRELFASILT